MLVKYKCGCIFGCIFGSYDIRGQLQVMRDCCLDFSNCESCEDHGCKYYEEDSIIELTELEKAIYEIS